MADKKTESFLLGSGLLYVMEFTGVIPPDEEIEKEENRLGRIKGGATLEYKPSFYSVEDDLGYIKKQLLTAEEVSFKSGIMVPNVEFVSIATPTAKLTKDAAAGKRTLEVGGLTNADGKTYLVRFVHKSVTEPLNALRVTIVGTNQSGFSLAFAKDKETVVDMEWSAEPLDNNGRLLRIVDSIPTEASVPEGGEA